LKLKYNFILNKNIGNQTIKMADSNKNQKIEYSNGDIYEGQIVNG
jgi:hypothetical protein